MLGEICVQIIQQNFSKFSPKNLNCVLIKLLCSIKYTYEVSDFSLPLHAPRLGDLEQIMQQNFSKFSATNLKVPKREIFDRSDFPDFYTRKSSWVGDLLVKL